MPKIWTFFNGDCLFDPNGTPIGSCEEASALFGRSFSPNRNSHPESGNDRSPEDFRRPKRRHVNPQRPMGSNVSRRSGKGLSGRRAQSSGSLYRMLAPRVGRMLNACGNGNVRHRGLNKLSGSLPNRLDEKRGSSGAGSSAESLYHPGSNSGEIFRRERPKSRGLLFRGEHDPGGGCDQGCGPEWSSEEKDLLLTSDATLRACSPVGRTSQMAFITKENTFEARLEKGSRGLGLSVTGGIDAADQHPGLIRIKKIFPHEPAWECGTLESGDIILEANGITLTGLTNHEALEVLRTAPNQVFLKICRPPRDAFAFPAVDSGGQSLLPPPPPKRDPNRNVLSSSHANNSATNQLPPPSTEPHGEFDLILNKVNGSLGFTLRKEDESVLGHYVRALVREPAISDGRIRPGDKIVSVNGKDISPMSHGEAVAFLRQTGNEVRLRLYRDPAQTPISALSPTESHKTFRLKPVLRKEAMDMLCTLAVRKLSPNGSTSSGSRSRLRSTSPGSSPRRRKLTKTPDDRWKGDSTEIEGEESIGIFFPEGNELHERVEEEEEAGGAGTAGGGTSEPASMPHLVPKSDSEFAYANPVYQSVHRGGSGRKERLSEEREIADSIFEQRGGSQGLLKWKNVVFTAEEEEKGNGPRENGRHQLREQVLTVELCRGWNSRLGFSLKNSDSKTLISAIYPDSVAAKDGRLRTGDEIIMINEEPTKGKATSELIDLLRKVRGTIAITIVRKSLEEGESRS